MTVVHSNAVEIEIESWRDFNSGSSQNTGQSRQRGVSAKANSRAVVGA